MAVYAGSLQRAAVLVRSVLRPPGVLPWRYGLEMGGVAAESGAAHGVINVVAGRKRSIHPLPRDAVRTNRTAVELELPIAVPERAGGPKPALVRPTTINLAPEAVDALRAAPAHKPADLWLRESKVRGYFSLGSELLREDGTDLNQLSIGQVLWAHGVVSLRTLLMAACRQRQTLTPSSSSDPKTGCS